MNFVMASLSSNRTFMELKLQKQIATKANARSNRTFMELK